MKQQMKKFKVRCLSPLVELLMFLFWAEKANKKVFFLEICFYWLASAFSVSLWVIVLNKHSNLGSHTFKIINGQIPIFENIVVFKYFVKYLQRYVTRLFETNSQKLVANSDFD